MTKLLNVREVATRIGMSRTWIYERVGERSFPAGLKTGVRARRWTEESVDQWIATRADAGQALALVKPGHFH